MYLTVDSFIDIKNIITGSNNVTSNKVDVKIWGYNKMYMDKDLMEDDLHELIDESNEKKKINHRDFYFAFLSNIHPFYDEM